jgi:serine/threonine protein kinase
MATRKKKASKPIQTSQAKKRQLPVEEVAVSQKKRKQIHPAEKEITTMGKPLLERDIDLEKDIVGTGTFSQVYKGTFRKQSVAVKLFKLRVTDEEFSKEVIMLRNLNHDRIVKFIGYANFEFQKGIVMEFMDRGTLFDVLHKKLHEFTWLEKLKIIKQVTEAMKYLHARQIAHCDLSSKNLLVGQNFEIKLSDFGQCEKMDQLLVTLDEYPNGKLRGTLRWMSKEILQKESNALDKCDVWSFGVIMFEIGSSTIPYWDLTDMDVRAEIKKGAWPVAKDFNIWMTQKISNKWKLLMDLCFQAPTNRPTFEILDLDVDLLIQNLEAERKKST